MNSFEEWWEENRYRFLNIRTVRKFIANETWHHQQIKIDNLKKQVEELQDELLNDGMVEK